VEIEKFDRLKKMLKSADSKHAASAKKLSEIADIVNIRTCWSELLSAVQNCMQDGMWIVSLDPKVSGGKIARVDITVQGFSDCLEDNDDGTSTERFRDRLRATPKFGEKTDIISEMLVESYLRRFTIKLDLEKPLSVK
jgi:hypothetical protein